MRKCYVLDTNVLLHDPEGVLHAFEDNDVVIPIVVIEELDNLKRDSSVGSDVREITRQLDELTQTGDIAEKGVPTKGGGHLRIDSNGLSYNKMPLGMERKPDNIILLALQRLIKAKKGKQQVILVTKDLNLRVKASAMGVKAEDYLSTKTVSADRLYTGSMELKVSASDIQLLYRDGSIDLSSNEEIAKQLSRAHPNVCCFLTSDQTGAQGALAIYKRDAGVLRLVKTPAKWNRSKRDVVCPRNDRQCFAYELAYDSDIDIVTLIGKAGTGKTLMSLLAGVRLVERNLFKKIMVFRPNVEVGESLGFLPGDINEKFAPWAKPIIECLNLIFSESENSVEKMIENGKLEIQPFNYIRGSTYSETFIVVDETQNLSPHVVTTAVTRVGERSKMILTGDVLQIDNRFLDSDSNGLSYAVSRLAGQGLYSHLTLIKSERSRVAELAATLM